MVKYLKKIAYGKMGFNSTVYAVRTKKDWQWNIMERLRAARAEINQENGAPKNK